MSNNKFNTQTGYSLDLNNITSKIRLDFNTNVVNPTNAVLGTDKTLKEFVLLDQSLLQQNNTDGLKNTFLSTVSETHSGKIKNYVFEKLLDPSVVGCENCGDRSKYIPAEGVDSSGQITDISVLPIVNKDVIAEIEISAESYHTFDIDLVGHRKICDDSGNCFDQKQQVNFSNLPNLSKNWLSRSFESNTEITINRFDTSSSINCSLFSPGTRVRQGVTNATGLVVECVVIDPSNTFSDIILKLTDVSKTFIVTPTSGTTSLYRLQTLSGTTYTPQNASITNVNSNIPDERLKNLYNTSLKNPFTILNSLTAASFASTTPSANLNTHFPPYNAPSAMDIALASSDHTIIDYGCCRCCSFYEDFINGLKTEDQAKQECNDTNLYNLNVPNFGNGSGFYDYCTTKNKTYLEYNKDIVTNNVSHCDIIKFKIEQYGSYPNPHLPECQNSVGPDLSNPVPRVAPSCPALNTGFCGFCKDLIANNETGDSCFQDCLTFIATGQCNKGNGAVCEFNEECASGVCDGGICVGGGGGGTIPDGGSCSDDSDCVNGVCTGGICGKPPGSDCTNDIECVGGVCIGGKCQPTGGGCTQPNCITPVEYSAGICNVNDIGTSIQCCACDALRLAITSNIGDANSICGPQWNVMVDILKKCDSICSRPPINDLCGCCNELCPQACCGGGGTPQPSDCDYSDCCGTISYDITRADVDGGGIASTCSNTFPSTLHNADIQTIGGILVNTLALGRCKNNVEREDNIYKVSRSSSSCYCVPETISDTKNYCSLSANTFRNIFDEVSWHLLGGHFYANKNLRDFIYNQEGTIHFTSSINSNFTSFNDNKTTAYHIENIKSDGKKYLLNYSDSILAPSLYNTDNAYLSLGYGYITTKIVGGVIVPKISERIVKKYTYYNRDIQNYLSEYRTNNNITPITEVDYGSGNSTSNITASPNITPISAYTFSVASSTNPSTELIETGSYISDSPFNEWPLSNSLFEYKTTGRQSFTLETTNAGPPVDWSRYNGTNYYSTITPTDTVQVVTGSGSTRTPTSGKPATTHKKYLVNNGIRQDYGLVNDSRDFGYTEGGIFKLYENYKFLGRLIDDETIEISNGNAIVDESANLLSYSTDPINNLSAKILNQIFTQLDLNSTTDPKVVTINAYYHTNDLNNNKVFMTQNFDVLDDGTLLKSFNITGPINSGPSSGSSGGKITIKLDRKYTRWKNVSGLRRSPNNFYFMFKVKNVSKAYTDSITFNKDYNLGYINYNPSSSDHLKEQFKPLFTYLSRTKSTTLLKNEFELFTIDSAKFSTPDYASYDGTAFDRKADYDQLVIPMRGLQYQYYKKNPANNYGVMSEVDDYPIIRIIRKNNGKFYLQILAGSFPYYHLLVHEPVFKKLGVLDDGNYDLGLVWRNRLCNRKSNWYDYVATTKWTCSIKHTEFTTNIPGWKRVEETSQTGTGAGGKRPSVIGRKEETIITIPRVPELPIDLEEEPGGGEIRAF